MSKSLLAILLVFLFPFFNASAQPDQACTVDQWREQIGTISSMSGEIVSGVNSEEEALQALLLIEQSIESVRTNCAGNVLTSEDYPNGIVGPLTFDGTLYQVV